MITRISSFRQGAVAEASSWFIEFRAGDVTPALRARFEMWLRASPEHIQAYLEVAAGWSELPTADPERRIDLQVLVARARQSRDDNVVRLSHPAPARGIAPRARWLALAASLAGIAILAGTGFWLLGQGSTYGTGAGEQRTVVLPDGSTVILNALTTIRVRMSRRDREIDLLRGQAFFHDVHEPNWPFIVRSGDATVRAVGTQFDVDRKSDGMVVTVLEGRVAVAQSADEPRQGGRIASFLAGAQPSAGDLMPVLASAGQQVIVVADNVQAPKRVNVASATAWLHGRLVFDDTPLGKVAEQFNLYNSRHLIILDPELRKVGISGVYSAADPDSLIGFLRAQPSLHVVETPTEIRVSERSRK
ncbi:MAG TPA: FecR domain-containing protein [Pseudonocardiaceae bacterium]|nr:FecR domain-containing protein [Pseudonocardiaceae bacterium]